MSFVHLFVHGSVRQICSSTVRATILQVRFVCLAPFDSLGPLSFHRVFVHHQICLSCVHHASSVRQICSLPCVRQLWYSFSPISTNIYSNLWAPGSALWSTVFLFLPFLFLSQPILLSWFRNLVRSILARDPGQAHKNTTHPSVFFWFIASLVVVDRLFLFLSISRLCFFVFWCWLLFVFQSVVMEHLRTNGANWGQ